MASFPRSCRPSSSPPIFFFTHTATTEIYTLSLHDALPILAIFGIAQVLFTYALQKRNGRILLWCGYVSIIVASSLNFFVLIKIPYLGSLLLVVPGTLYGRSEEHTSELQSQSNLVCRLLLEK